MGNDEIHICECLQYIEAIVRVILKRVLPHELALPERPYLPVSYAPHTTAARLRLLQVLQEKIECFS